MDVMASPTKRRRPWLEALKRLQNDQGPDHPEHAGRESVGCITPCTDKPDESLADESTDVQWRTDAFRTLIPTRGPIWAPRLRDTPRCDMPGHCSLSGDDLPAERLTSPWRRCAPCVRALRLVLNEVREGTGGSAVWSQPHGARGLVRKPACSTQGSQEMGSKRWGKGRATPRSVEGHRRAPCPLGPIPLLFMDLLPRSVRRQRPIPCARPAIPPQHQRPPRSGLHSGWS
jgi:hypothetical protein